MCYDTEHNNDDFHERNFFTGSKPEYNKSKGQVWNEITTKIDNGESSDTNHNIITPLKTKFFYAIEVFFFHPFFNLLKNCFNV
jgi:hypothetical protein